MDYLSAANSHSHYGLISPSYLADNTKHRPSLSQISIPAAAITVPHQTRKRLFLHKCVEIIKQKYAEIIPERRAEIIQQKRVEFVQQRNVEIIQQRYVEIINSTILLLLLNIVGIIK